MRRRHRWIFSSLVALAACGSPAMESANDVCSRLVAWAFEATPEQAAGAMAAYGPDGVCWKTQSVDVCRQGCANGLDGLHRLHRSSPACALCLSDADCGGATPACDTARGECVA